MACTNCSSGGCSTTAGKGGCRSNGGCSSGGCNKMNVFDWLSDLPFATSDQRFGAVEVSFKNGSRKGFYQNTHRIDCHTHDWVVVEVPTGGYDIGQISLSGELVRLQMKKRRHRDTTDNPRILRIATERDLQLFREAQQLENQTMLLARVIVNDLKLDMKIGDVEYQGDTRKATFYYTADDRVDFRELIRIFAKEFKVRIEMRQIGARQEARRIGGIGTCGRELCCSSWLTDFKSVSTIAARYQNLAINQAKLSGQCGRLKCCLNYELDSYLDALTEFPQHADQIDTALGMARLIKTDIFKRLMWYALPQSPPVPITVERVKQILSMNRRGQKPDNLVGENAGLLNKNLAPVVKFHSGVGEIKLEELDPNIGKKKKKKKKKPEPNTQQQRTNSSKADHNSSNNPSAEPTQNAPHLPQQNINRSPKPHRKDRPPRPNPPQNGTPPPPKSPDTTV